MRWLFWIGLSIICFVIEMLHLRLIAICFGIAALAAGIACALGFTLPWQMIFFASFALVSFAALRPAAKKLRKEAEFPYNLHW